MVDDNEIAHLAAELDASGAEERAKLLEERCAD
jgi:hypothetical protein